MDRARDAGPGGAGGVLRRWWLIAAGACTLGCSGLFPDFGRVIAIEIVGSTAPSVEEGDTLRLHARAVSAAGDTVPEAVIVWGLLDVDSGQVGFTLDTASGLVTAFAPGTGRVQARVDGLRSGTIVVTATPAPDSIAAGGDTSVVVEAAAIASAPLIVAVYDLTTAPGQQLALAGKVVHFEVADPPAGSDAASGFFLTQSDTVPGSDPHRVVAQTAADGRSQVIVRRRSGLNQPDSARVDAVVLTAGGEAVPGSPIRFHVAFRHN